MFINRYYRDLCNNEVLANSNDMKKTWDNINMIINKSKPSSHIDKLNVKDKQLHQPKSISNALNRYFCSIPGTLASKITKTNRKFSSYMSRKQLRFRFDKVSEIEVFLMLKQN